jgi:8-oxo-dGTP pyrophosphatase MutT (NUDIX family)
VGRDSGSEPLYGASIVVFRRENSRIQYLILHRKHLGTQYEGDWAWGPPGGARLPDESVEDCASREMLEETGVDVPLTRTTFGIDDWVVFVAEVEDDDIVLSDEHDRFRWVGLDDAVASCLPQFTAEPFALVDALLVGQ